MQKVYFWPECIKCGCRCETDKFHYTCPQCGGLLMIERDEDWVDRQVGTGVWAQRNFDGVRFSRQRDVYPNGSGVFMWLPLLLPGFPTEQVVSLREGSTDLWETPDWLKTKVGLGKLFIKMEGQLPTESFKDRGMSAAISEVLRLQHAYPDLGINAVACASTGDTSASAAAYAAYVRDRLECLVFLPNQRVSPEQLFQAMAHAARVILVNHPEGFDACMKLITSYCEQHPEIVLVNSKNAFRLVGQETIALELCQDLHWQAPDWISIPAGNGGNLTALLVSLKRMYNRGMINRLPGIIVAQAKNANPVVRWIRNGFGDYQPLVHSQATVASAMDIQDPVSFPRIQKLLSEFEVLGFDASESKIQRTRAMFMGAGANICPQGAVALDAVLQAREANRVKEDDVVVAIGTASGVKFSKSGLEHHLHGNKEDFANPPIEVEGTMEAIQAFLS